MIELKDGTHIGELCFKGIDESCSTEIGYGISDGFQGCGYASEAVSAITSWALKQDAINCVTAEVEKDNRASIKVLEKSGFKMTDKIGEEDPIYCKYKNNEKDRRSKMNNENLIIRPETHKDYKVLVYMIKGVG